MEEMKKAVAQSAKLQVLKTLIKTVNNGAFSGKTFCAQNGVNTYFIQAAINLGVINPVNKIGNNIIYKALMDENDKGLVQASEMMQAEIKKLYDNREKRPKKEDVKKPQLVSSEKTVYIDKPIDFDKMLEADKAIFLQGVPVQYMVDELHRRGYSGVVERIESYKI